MSNPERRVLTLVLVIQNGRILLGMKKRGFGEGRWNGFGGKILEGETIEEAARRELTEETGITAGALAPRGTLTFHFENDPVTLEAHVFSASKWTGDPVETDEMRPRWFPFDGIPYQTMWADDIYWLPLVLAGKNITGEFWFRNTEELIKHILVQS